MSLLKFFSKKRYLIKKSQKRFFSQCGEDQILHHLFSSKETGFYVDIGAHHPFNLSNTAIFHEKGWRGINIEPCPEGHKIFNKLRPKDINLNIGIAKERGQLKYYAFNNSAYNTFQKDVAQNLERNSTAKILYQCPIDTYRLENVLNEYIPPNQKIDFMNVDVEGMDLEVLESNDWNRWRPSIVLAEEWNVNDCCQLNKGKMVEFLKQKTIRVLQSA